MANDLNFKNDVSLLKSIIEDQISPSYGSSGVGVVTLAAAKAATMLKNDVFTITLFVSPHIYRSNFGVGVPRLGKCGAAMMVAAGFVMKNPEKKLNCLDDVTPDVIEEATQLADVMKRIINVEVQYSMPPVYCRLVAVDTDRNRADIIIKDDPRQYFSIKFNNEELIKEKWESPKIKLEDTNEELVYGEVMNYFTVKRAVETVKKMTLDDLSWLKWAVDTNHKLYIEGLNNPDPDALGIPFQKMLKANDNSACYDPDHWTSKVLSAVIAGMDARMHGTPLPVAAATNGGDHGICITIPLEICAKEHDLDSLKLYQSVALAIIVCWKITRKIGYLSSMCTANIAAVTGALAGMAYQLDYDTQQIINLVNYHLATQNGLLCDGGNGTCAYKVASSFTTGFMEMAAVKHGGKVLNLDGIVNDDCETTMKNIEKYSRENTEDTVNAVVDCMDRSLKKEISEEVKENK